MAAFSWLEENLEDRIYMIDTDDLIGLIESIVHERKFK